MKLIFLNIVFVLLQYLLFCIIRKNHISNNLFKTSSNIKFLKIYSIFFLIIFLHLIPINLYGPLIQSDHYVSGLEEMPVKDVFSRQGENFLFGENSLDYDHNTEVYLKTFNQVTFSDFVLNVQAGHNIFRHPVSGLTWFALWTTTKSTVIFKYIILIIFILNALLLNSLIKKITKSDYIALLSLIFFLISPLIYSHAASHDWTLSMSKSQIGLFFLYSSLLLFFKFLKSPNIIFLILSLLSFCFSIMSWEVFIGFLLCYPIIYLSHKNLNIKENINSKKKVKIYLLIFSIIFITAPVLIKFPINYLTHIFGYSSLSPNYSFVNPYIFYKTWMYGMFGIEFNEVFLDLSRDRETLKKPLEKSGLFNKLIFNLFAISDKYNWLNQLIRIHISNPLYYFNHSMINIWVALFYFISFSILNILIIYPQKYSIILKNYNLNFSFLFGFTIFISSIITALIANGNIYIRYIYTGYFGLILMILMIIILLDKIYPNKDTSIILNIALLTFCEISILEVVFPGELA